MTKPFLAAAAVSAGAALLLARWRRRHAAAEPAPQVDANEQRAKERQQQVVWEALDFSAAAGEFATPKRSRTTVHSYERTLLPRGPNGGHDESWFPEADEEADYTPPKRDLLHRGHAEGGCLVVAMVGLPARGKTYVARKLTRYLQWNNYRARAFVLGNYRRERCGAAKRADFFDPSNAGATAERDAARDAALDDVAAFLGEEGEIAVYDAANIQRAERTLVAERLIERVPHVSVLWVECQTDSPALLERMQEQIVTAPDYAGVPPEEARADFRARVAFYERAYEPLDRAADARRSFVKLIDGGQHVELHCVTGHLRARIATFVANLRPARRAPIFISRHGESQYNTLGLLGGDSALSERGEEYARTLARFMEQVGPGEDGLVVWHSTLRRTKMTARDLRCKARVQWRALRELESGVCDSMTYKQVAEQFPLEFAARQRDKLSYRYPAGESYLDLIHRLEPVILELERCQEPILIVAHQATLRCLYAYFVEYPQRQVPYLSMPLHTLIQLDVSDVYKTRETRHLLC